MSHPDVDLVRRSFDAWNTGDLDAFLGFLGDDVEWHEIEGRLDRPQSTGRAKLREGLASLFDTWEYYRLDPEEIRPLADGRLLAILRETARGRTSGLEIEGRWGYVITVRDGAIARVDAYRDPEQALEAADA